ncbi:hypothetical protein GHK52_09665 [Lactococcus garvieae]|nr:hypothetical protein [Lactococcus garvieae]
MKLLNLLNKKKTDITLINKNIRDFSMELSEDEKIIIDFLNNIDKEFLNNEGKNDFLAQGNYFEKFLLSLFRSAGYETHITEKRFTRNHIEYIGDKNVDLIAVKGKERIAIQAKSRRINTKEPKLINKSFINNYSGISDNGWTKKCSLLLPYLILMHI